MLGTVARPGLLLVTALLLLCLAARPLRHCRHDDLGDGMAVVSIPRPRSVSLGRVLAFYTASTAITLALVAPRPGPVDLYQALVTRLALLADPRPLAVVPYALHVSVALRLVVVANIVSFGAVVRARPLRRAAIACHAVAFVAVAALLDALEAVAACVAHLPTETAALYGSFLVLVLAVALTLRLLTTTFVLPRPTATPDLRTHHRSESVLLAVGVVVSVVAVLALVDFCDTLVGRSHPVAFLVAFTGFPLVFDVLLLFLLATTRSIRPPAGEGEPPPLTTITPAFNEELTIERTLRSLDAAAGSYGGRVTVIVADDGSHDATALVAEAVMATFRHARGRLVRARHGGKAAALNKALGAADTEIVVRVDADVVVAEDAFDHLPDWFANPSVGMVGALALPDPRARSWYAKGRLFECLIGFAFGRLALERVDAINCIPGTFTAFRAAPARFAGGFVTGMNGEDSDLTMVLGRLGYQVVVDTRIRIYEDVPATLREFRERRVRWNRAGVQILARHSPVLAPGGSPRSWFFYLRAATVRITALLRPLVFVTGMELSLLNPATRAIFARVLVFYLVAGLPALAVLVVLAVRHGFARKLVWLPLWFPFTLARRVVALEGLLTLPTRPVLTARRSADRPAPAIPPTTITPTTITPTT